MSNQGSFERGYRRYCEVVQGSGVQTALNSFIVNHQGTQYVGNIQKAIKDFENAINERCKDNKSSIETLRGIAAEEHHVGTFNYDAAVKDHKVRATTPKSNKTASTDAVTTDGQQISFKVGNTAKHSADGQSIDLWKKFKQDYEGTKKNISF